MKEHSEQARASYVIQTYHVTYAAEIKSKQFERLDLDELQNILNIVNEIWRQEDVQAVMEIVEQIQTDEDFEKVMTLIYMNDEVDSQ